MTERLTNVLAVVAEMDESEKIELIRQMIGNERLSEDFEDALIIALQKDEPTRDFEEFLDELREEGRPV